MHSLVNVRVFSAVLLVLTAASSMDIAAAERRYSISGVSAVAITGVNATIVAGPNASLVMTGEQRDLNKVKVAVENGELRLKPYNSSVFNWKTELLDKITVQITTPHLREVAIAGAGTVTASGIKEKHFEVSVGGGGTFVSLDADVQAVGTSIAGGGTITLGGNCNRADLSIGGSGTLHASTLKCESTHISLAGGGTVEAFASVSATTVTAGGGNVVIYGNPAERKTSTSRGGTVSFPVN
jgi:Putative auto-transporter adhesin, head GIN domain